jgi:hypothetical protein
VTNRFTFFSVSSFTDDEVTLPCYCMCDSGVQIVSVDNFVVETILSPHNRYELFQKNGLIGHILVFCIFDFSTAFHTDIDTED